LIQVKHLVKRYGGHLAVDDVSFDILDGQIYGFLGPNGAGKTTTMNIITGCLAATSGQVTIDGHDIYDEPLEAKKSLGYLPEQPPLYLDMTPWEYLHFVAEVKGLARKERGEQIEKVMEKTQITDMRKRLIKHLSKGYRQRVGFAQAILGDPSTIILDEPTVGLDPIQIVEVRDLIRTLGQSHTVILSSHILSEVSAVCDRVLIISKGKLVAEDTTENLSSHLKGTVKLLLTVRGEEAGARQVLSAFKDILNVTVKNGRESGSLDICAEISSDKDIRDQLSLAFAKKEMPVLSMSQDTVSLEDIFIELTGIEQGAACEKAGPAKEAKHLWSFFKPGKKSVDDDTKEG
jgi:ABC-2 type transport system ATP-binding protein